MDKILRYPIIPQNIYEKYRAIKRKPVYDSISMIVLLKNLIIDASKKDKSESSIWAKLILFDLKNYLNHPSIYKEKYTASALEYRLALLGDGRTSDDLPKINPNISSLLSAADIAKIPTEIHPKICSNFREKGDLIFYNPRKDNSYKVSIKSLIPKNKEINFGAFDFTALVMGILEDTFLALGERKSKLNIEIEGTKYEIGRGSKAQLQTLFQYVEMIGKKDEFLERWEIVFRGVFKEDIFIFIKNYKRLQIHLLSNEDFVKCVMDSLKNNWSNMAKSVINRWEGNSIRMSRDEIIEYCSFSIDADFKDFFNERKVIAKLNELQVYKTEELLNIDFD